MRSKLVLAVALCLALSVPATALALTQAPNLATRGDVAVAYYTQGDKCLVFSLGQGWDHQPAVGGPVYGNGFYAQLTNFVDDSCQPTSITGAPGWVEYRIIPLTAAYLVTPEFTVGGLAVTVDIAWVVVTDRVPAIFRGSDSTWVGKLTDAHLTGTVVVNGTLWAPHQANLNSGVVQINR